MPQISPQSLIHAVRHGQAPPRSPAPWAAHDTPVPWVAYYMAQTAHAGLTHESDVVSLDASLGGQMDATNLRVLACSNLQPTDVTAWGGIYQAWQALHQDWLTFKQQQDSTFNPIGKLTADYIDGQYLDKMNLGTAGQSYAQWAAVYQTKADAACKGLAPPDPPTPAPPSSALSPAAVALIVLGAGALAAGLAWAGPLVLGALAARGRSPSRKGGSDER